VIIRVTPDLDLIGAYAYVNAIVESGDNAGKRVETFLKSGLAVGEYASDLLGCRASPSAAGLRLHRRVLGRHRQHPALRITRPFDAMIRYETGPCGSGQMPATSPTSACHHVLCAWRLLLGIGVRCWQRDVQVLGR